MSTRPAIKWVGSNNQIIPLLERMFPENYGRYIDPFAGSLSVPLHFGPDTALLSDANEELIITHQAIRDNVGGVIAALRRHKDERRYFEAVRRWDWRNLPPVDVAARMLYLNRTSFNGLYRLNRAGGFNASYGAPKANGRVICDVARLRSVSRALQGFSIMRQDFRVALQQARPNDLVFLDPPCNKGTTRYTAGGFSWGDQEAVAAEFQRLNELGCHVIITNPRTDDILELYAGCRIQEIGVRVNVNRDVDGRTGTWVVITNIPRVPAQGAIDAVNDDDAMDEVA